MPLRAACKHKDGCTTTFKLLCQMLSTFPRTILTRTTKSHDSSSNDLLFKESKLISSGLLDIASECQYFAGFGNKNIPSVNIGQKDNFPHIVNFEGTQNKETLDYIGKQCREYLDENLTKHGAVLFKNLPLQSVKDFAVIFESMKYSTMDYDGGASSRPKDADANEFYEASDEHPSVVIEPHNEQAYFTKSPTKLIFYAKEPAGPGCGGENFLCHNRNLLKSIKPEYADKVIKKKIRYIRNCPDRSAALYKPWQETFYTNDKKEVEKSLKSVSADWEWRSNDWLHFWNIVEPLREHPITKETLWFNQITVAMSDYYRYHPEAEKWKDLKDDECPTHAKYGDGEEFEKDFILNIRQATYSNSVVIKLEKHDVLVLDNLQAQHGRLPFRGKRSLTTVLMKD